MASKSTAGQGIGLITDFFDGLRKEIKRRGGDENTSLERLRDAVLIGKVADLLQPAVQFLDRVVFPIKIRSTLDLATLVANGKYDLVDVNILNYWKLIQLSITDLSGQQEGILLHYDNHAYSKNVLDDMERQGLRPGTDKELLELGAQHPDLQRIFPIVELGTVVQVGAEHRVLCLRRDACKRSLGLAWFGVGWGEDCRFLAFRKPA